MVSTIHFFEEVGLEFTHAMLGRHRAAHGRHLGGPPREQLGAARVFLGGARQNVHMHVVASNVAPRGTLKTAFGERAAIHRDYIAQAIVRHRHVATEFRDGRVGAAALVDKHVHAFGNRMAEEALTHALGFGRRDPRALGIAAARFQLLAQHHELGYGSFLIVAAQLDEHACSRIVGEFGKLGECRVVRLLRAQNVERSAVKVLDGRRVFERAAHGDREIDRLGLAREKAARAPYLDRHRQKRQLKLANHAKRATCANEQVNCVHVVARKIARRIFRLRHIVRGKAQHQLATALGHKAKLATGREHLAAAQGERITIGERHTHRFNVRAHRPIGIAARARRVACHDAAKRCRCFGRIGREKLRGCGFKLSQHGEAFIVPARRVETRLLQHVAQLHERKARLHAHKEAAVGAAAHAEHAVHARRVQHAAAMGNRASRQAGTRTLNGDRHTCGMQGVQRIAHIGFRFREQDTFRRTHTARFVAQVLFKLISAGHDFCHRFPLRSFLQLFAGMFTIAH